MVDDGKVLADSITSESNIALLRHMRDRVERTIARELSRHGQELKIPDCNIISIVFSNEKVTET